MSEELLLNDGRVEHFFEHAEILSIDLPIPNQITDNWAIRHFIFIRCKPFILLISFNSEWEQWRSLKNEERKSEKSHLKSQGIF